MYVSLQHRLCIPNLTNCSEWKCKVTHLKLWINAYCASIQDVDQSKCNISKVLVFMKIWMSRIQEATRFTTKNVATSTQCSHWTFFARGKNSATSSAKCQQSRKCHPNLMVLMTNVSIAMSIINCYKRRIKCIHRTHLLLVEYATYVWYAIQRKTRTAAAASQAASQAAKRKWKRKIWK